MLPFPTFLFGLIARGARRRRAERLAANGAPRRIRIQWLRAEPAGAVRPEYYRVAFEFLDPPGPWSIQFFEIGARYGEHAEKVQPGLEARFFESEDGAQTRAMTLVTGEFFGPR